MHVSENDGGGFDLLTDAGEVLATCGEEKTARRLAFLWENQANGAQEVGNDVPAGRRYRGSSSDDDQPEEWAGPESSTVTAWPSGLVYVRFPAKPGEELRAELRGAGFRWRPQRKAWKGTRESLPTSLVAS